MRAKAIVEVKLANASRRRAEIPVPICKVWIGESHGVSVTLPDGDFAFIDLLRG